MKILMLSSSRCGQEAYLETARPMIEQHLNSIDSVLFIPYAGVTVSWDDYTQMVQSALPNCKVEGIHNKPDSIEAVQQAKAVLVGGGNTFHLLHTLYQQGLIEPLRHKILGGMPYIGWSAGSNICGQSIRTTNDMPIIEPKSFEALKLVPFQLNPHYTDYQAPGHNGETRDQRIAEFCQLNPDMPVIGIREGSALLRTDESLKLVGKLDAVVFQGNSKTLVDAGSALSRFL